MALSSLKPLQRHNNPREAPLSSPVAVDRIKCSLPVGACIDIKCPLCLDGQQAPTEPKPDFTVAAAEFRSGEVLRCDFVVIGNLAVTVVREERSQQRFNHILESLVGLRPSRQSPAAPLQLLAHGKSGSDRCGRFLQRLPASYRQAGVVACSSIWQPSSGDDQATLAQTGGEHGAGQTSMRLFVEIPNSGGLC